MADDPTSSAEVPATLAGLRADQALVLMFPDYSRSQLSRWLQAGHILIDGVGVKPRARLKGGERVELHPPELAPLQWPAQPLNLQIVHADSDLIVIDKPAGLVVHPGAGNPDHTLVNALIAFDPDLGALPRAGIVHRLDKDTTGLMVVARSHRAHVRLVAALKAHAVTRCYDAIVHGVLVAGRTISEPIGRDPRGRTRMAVVETGRHATSHLRVVRRYRAHTHVRVTLETGRTHQIRVHLSHLGHAVVGDPTYGGRGQSFAGASAGLRAALQQFSRQALHASRLELEHPGSGTPLAFNSPLPADMVTLLTLLDTDLGT